MTVSNISRQSGPAVHGHRGARGRMPENSLAAVSYAVACGADGAEVDISATADNVLIVHHDLHLSSDLTLDENGKRLGAPVAIRSKPAMELAQFDVGQIDRCSDYGKKFRQQFALPETRIPTLDDFIDKVLKTSDENFVLNIELKGDPYQHHLVPQPDHYVEILISTLMPYLSASKSFSSRLFLQSFDWRLMLELQRRQPGLLCGLLTDQQFDGAPRIPLKGKPCVWTADLDLADFESVPHMIAETGAGVWSSQFNDLNQSLVDEAHNRGIQVYCWTVNELTDMERMIAIGVDVITTDYPERLVGLLDEKKRQSCM